MANIKVLIAKENKSIIQKYFSNPVFNDQTANTVTFLATPYQIEKAKNEMKRDGYNYFSLMSY